ncbi:hypothetical protein THAOC_35617 [Thalassiosira oceanica]|uniref:Uncharacterized protein n=1 Tax=Thalassiosira oceanica TaxID=159749 RepID=K0RGT4_THAOC|nr:hypothetical protein THAOC_35617 [Thalassiosira oceanica]|eukprot:EJK45752.1 hypothetical protein THAOC_35617 [Thalassiosira oceanica]
MSSGDGRIQQEDDDEIDPSSLGDWRQFRMNLSQGASSTSSEAAIDGIDLGGAKETKVKERPRSVSAKNEELLKKQNSKLAEEYMNGVWAHESALVEVGGLVCRLPLEAEIYRGKDSSLNQRLMDLLDSDQFGNVESGDIPNSLQSSASTGGAAASSTASPIQRSAEDSAPAVNDDSSTFSPLAAKTTYWYRGAERMLKEELESILSNADPSGKLEADKLSPNSMEMLQRYVDHQQNWQEVCLVVEKDDRLGYAKTLTINRPMAFTLSKSMGRLVLMGALSAENGQAVVRQEGDGKETMRLVKFLSAFENQCAVYVGGEDGMDQPGLLIHGIEDLEGATEISPGTGIYEGGIDAAIDGVLSGKYSSLDFRFFVGHRQYTKGGLEEAVRQSKYQPIACSRPLVLKQCIKLPKPLWHEIMEFCGGELKEISKLEFAKRDDLQ